MLQEAHHVRNVAEPEMLLEVVGLEQLDALLGHALAQLATLGVHLVSLEKQVDDGAGAVFFAALFVK